MRKALVNRTFAYAKWIICLGILVSLPGCASKSKGLISNEFMRPFRDMQKAVYFAMRGDVPRKSQNGRTHFSPWHKPGMNLKASSYKKKSRALLSITILGDRRPYWVDVVYRVEKLDGRKYKLDRYDNKIAAKYLQRIEEYLSSRPEERDVIDDFRPY